MENDLKELLETQHQLLKAYRKEIIKLQVLLITILICVDFSIILYAILN